MLSPRAFLAIAALVIAAYSAADFWAGYDTARCADQRLIQAARLEIQRARIENAALKEALMLPEPTPRPLDETAGMSF